MSNHHGVAAHLTGRAIPGNDAISAISSAGHRRLPVLEPLQIELLVLVGEIPHGCVVDGRRHLDKFGQDLISDWWLQPFETVGRRRLFGHSPEPPYLGQIYIRQHLASTRVVAGVLEPESLGELTRTLIIFSRANPDRVAARVASHSQRFRHDRRTVAAPAMIGMHEDLGPDQMQVVAGWQVHHEHPYGVARILRYVEIVFGGLEIPAVTHPRGQQLRDRWERLGSST